MATTMDTGLLTELRRAVDQSGSWTLMRDSYEAHQLLRFYPDFVDYEIDEDGYAVFTLTPEGMAATSPIKAVKSIEPGDAALLRDDQMALLREIGQFSRLRFTAEQRQDSDTWGNLYRLLTLGFIEETLADRANGIYEYAPTSIGRGIIETGGFYKSTTGATEVKQMLEESIEQKSVLTQLMGLSSLSREILIGMYEDRMGNGPDYWDNSSYPDQLRELQSAGFVFVSTSTDPVTGMMENQWRLTPSGRDAGYQLVVMRESAKQMKTKSALAAKLDQKIEKFQSVASYGNWEQIGREYAARCPIVNDQIATDRWAFTQVYQDYPDLAQSNQMDQAGSYNFQFQFMRGFHEGMQARGMTMIKPDMLGFKKTEKRIAGISMAAEALLQRMHHNFFVAGNYDYLIPVGIGSGEEVNIFELTGRGWARFIGMDEDGQAKVYQLTNEGIAAAEESLGLNKATKAQRKDYNGWTNYPTWAAALYITNEQWSDNERYRILASTYGQPISSTIAQIRSLYSRVYASSPYLQEDMKDQDQSQINWQEIASNWMADYARDLS